MADLIKNIICNWTTYKGTHCRMNINHNHDHTHKCSSKFCTLHNELIQDFQIINNSDELCETFEEIKIVPRSYKHIKSVMASMDNEDDNVDVYMAGGHIEEANIANSDYIILLSDNCRYYYKPVKGHPKAKDLKIILKRYCQNESIINVRDIKYCEDCYKKLKNVPRISVVR